MYGMINQGVRDLVVARAGQEAWKDVCSAAGMIDVPFDSFASYPDNLTFVLVQHAGERLGLSSHEILRAFGEHWITFTAAEGYGEMMRLFGDDFRSCIANLNRMHAHMGGMMPNLTPPRFVSVEHAPNQLTLHYHSSREGLGAMVEGLLNGLAKWFNEAVDIEPHLKGSRSDHDEFDIHIRPS